MYASLAHDILHAHGIAYAVTNAKLEIVHHSDNLTDESGTTLRGVSLLTVAPEALGNRQTLDSILEGTLERWELPCIRRVNRQSEPCFFNLRFSRVRVDKRAHGILYVQHDLSIVNVPPDELVDHHSELHALRERALRELRAPLTPLRGYLEMLADEEFGALSAEQRHVIGIMRQSVQRLVKLSEEWQNPASPS